jgi:two-component system C4-dicarboxylate transport sensor histidine kinase DctB
MRRGVAPRGVGTRLSLAFMSVAAMAVSACGVGWLSYTQLSREFDAVAATQLPALAWSARLAEAGAGVIGATPDLAAADGKDVYDRYREVLSARLRHLGEVLASRDDVALPVTAETIRRDIGAVDSAAARRFEREARIRALVEELRWLQADLVEEVDALVEESRRAAEAALRRRAASGLVQEEAGRREALLAVSAGANLLVGLLGRVAAEVDADDLARTLHFVGEAAEALEEEARALAGWTDAVTVRQITARLVGLAIGGPDNLPAMRREAIAAARDVGLQLAHARATVARLGELISAEVARSEAEAHAATERARALLRTGRSLLLAIALASVAVAVAVGWFYVRRILVVRLRLLTRAASEIARGAAAPPLPAMGRDELGRLAAALDVFRRTRDDLVQAAKLAGLGQMAAGLSHELNQPLAAIRAHAHNGGLLLARGRTEEARASFERIGAMTERTAELVRHLRRFARRPDAQIGTTGLLAAVQAALALLELRFREEGVRLLLDLPAAEVTVRGEAIRLEQVVVNLLANACDALRGSARREVAVTVRPPEAATGMAALRVADTGCGIPAEAQGAMFDPFFTTKPAGEGLGLGLSISYNIVRDFGGSLRMVGTGADGTVFEALLPARPAA